MICTILLSASDEATSAKPSFPINTVLAAINHVPNQRDAQKNKDLLWSQASCCSCYLAIFSPSMRNQVYHRSSNVAFRLHWILMAA